MTTVRSACGITIVAVLLCAAPGLEAQTRTGPFVGATFALVDRPDELAGDAAFGGHIGIRSPLGLVVMGEYLYAGKDFYYFDSANARWSGPVRWSQVPSGESSRSDWQFYRRRHVVGGSVGLSYPLGRLGLYSTAGIMINIVEPSDVADSYPAFKDAVTSSSLGEGPVFASYAFRFGAVYPARALIAGQVSYAVSFRNGDLGDNDRYIRSNDLFLVGFVIQPGRLW